MGRTKRVLAGIELALKASPSAQPFKWDSRLRFSGLVAAIVSMMEFEWSLQQIHLFFPFLFHQRCCIIVCESIVGASMIYFMCFDQVSTSCAWLLVLSKAGPL